MDKVPGHAMLHCLKLTMEKRNLNQVLGGCVTSENIVGEMNTNQAAEGSKGAEARAHRHTYPAEADTGHEALHHLNAVACRNLRHPKMFLCTMPPKVSSFLAPVNDQVLKGRY